MDIYNKPKKCGALMSGRKNIPRLYLYNNVIATNI